MEADKKCGFLDVPLDVIFRFRTEEAIHIAAAKSALNPLRAFHNLPKHQVFDSLPLVKLRRRHANDSGR